MNEVIAPAKNAIIIDTPEYTEAVRATESIRAKLTAGYTLFYEAGLEMIKFRDGKKYKTLGYRNFDEYCESEFGLKHTKSYEQVSIAESFPEDFVRTCVQNPKIGISKIAQISKAPKAIQDEIIQTVDLQEINNRELRAKIKELKRQHNLELDDQKDQYEKKLQELEQERENISVKYQFDKQAHRRELNEAKEKSEFLAAHITELERQIQELEDRPVEVMQSTAELEEIERLKSELEEVRSREQETKAEAEKMQNTSVEAAAKSEKQIKEMQARISELENQPVSGAEPDAKELFRPYFQACTHSIGLMMDFISKQKNSPDFAFLTSKVSQIAEVIEKQLQALKNQ
ncbi:MAG: hypothetical protein K2H82_01025 [Oscillospiraceae bacterium]|nr:hypothetical protein [Oscillospiraceae bacterium]